MQWNRFSLVCLGTLSDLPRLSFRGFTRLKSFPSSRLFNYSEIGAHRREVSFTSDCFSSALNSHENLFYCALQRLYLPNERKISMNLIKRASFALYREFVEMIRCPPKHAIPNSVW